MTKQIKCSKCKKDAVVYENKIYYCGPCYVNEFVGMHKRLRPKPLDNSFKSNCKTKMKVIDG